jgi:uncharacterized protein with von Willebrand factor type A (vWA) domain
MLAHFFKSLYSVGIQLAPSKTFDWRSILSYFKVGYVKIPWVQSSFLFGLGIAKSGQPPDLVLLAQFFNSLYSVGINVAPSKTFDWMSILSYFKVGYVKIP